MKQLISTLIVLSLIGGAGLCYMNHYQTTSRARAYEENLNELQRQFSERLGTVRAIDDVAQYEREISTLLSWYFAEIQKLRNQFPGHGDPERVLEEFEAERAAGNLSQEEFEQYMDHYQYVKWNFDQLEAGEYGLVVSGYSANLRFDIHAFERDRYQNQQQLRADFILWGAPRNIEDRRDRVGVTVRTVTVPVRFTRLFFQFLNEKGHIHGEMSGFSGEPYLRIVHPERWIPEFPPMAVLGRYWIELFPDEAEQFVWQLDIESTTTSGARVTANYEWHLEVPRSWQIGGEWGGVETTRAQEYIERAHEE